MNDIERADTSARRRTLACAPRMTGGIASWHRSRGLWCAALVVGLVACTASAMAAVASDAWITTRVKMLLLVSPEVNGTKLQVDSNGGTVTLFGTVPSEAQKAAAQHVAEQVIGVHAVRNLVAVVPSARQAAVERSDQALRENVALALRDDPSLRDSAIHVESVDAGTVVLGGRATTMSELRRALWIGRSVAGVGRVVSVVASPAALTDAEAWGAAMEAPARSNAARDNWVTGAVKQRLMADDRIPEQDVAVDTDNGVVTLFGTVPTDAAKRAAHIDAAGVPGVDDVKNELLVVRPAQSSTTGGPG